MKKLITAALIATVAAGAAFANSDGDSYRWGSGWLNEPWTLAANTGITRGDDGKFMCNYTWEVNGHTHHHLNNSISHGWVDHCFVEVGVRTDNDGNFYHNPFARDVIATEHAKVVARAWADQIDDETRTLVYQDSN